MINKWWHLDLKSISFFGQSTDGEMTLTFRSQSNLHSWPKIDVISISGTDVILTSKPQNFADWGCSSLWPSKRIGEKGFNTENYWLGYKWKLVLYSNKWLDLRIKLEKILQKGEIPLSKPSSFSPNFVFSDFVLTVKVKYMDQCC